MKEFVMVTLQLYRFRDDGGRPTCYCEDEGMCPYFYPGPDHTAECDSFATPPDTRLEYDENNYPQPVPGCPFWSVP